MITRERDVLRVATFNLWGLFADWPCRRALLHAELPALDVDVYLLQEVVCDETGGDQLRELSEMLGHEWTARVVAESRPHETEHEGVAILSRLPLHSTAVWPLPPSRPPRNRLEACVEWERMSLRLSTLHAAVSARDGRDEQIAALAQLKDEPLLLGCDLNAPPVDVRPVLGGVFADTLDWNEDPTWPLDADEFARKWEEKTGEKPIELSPRRLDYLLQRGLDIAASGMLALSDNVRSASDHRLVWADVRADARDQEVTV